METADTFTQMRVVIDDEGYYYFSKVKIDSLTGKAISSSNSHGYYHHASFTQDLDKLTKEVAEMRAALALPILRQSRQTTISDDEPIDSDTTTS